MFEVSVLASGSSGDCFYIGTEKAEILIDAGISCRQICLRLEMIGKSIQDIQGIFITHEHTDHVRGVAVLARRYDVTKANGVKAVAPMLSPPVVEYVMSLPAHERVGKIALREAVRGVVPDEILARTEKWGFPVPFVEWAQKEPVRSFVEERIGYVPPAAEPWSRKWCYDLLEATG